jgi:hypothetical protein
MNVPVSDGPGLASVEDMRALGYEGFLTVSQLRDEGAASVPVEPGAWVVLREGASAVPRFLARSTAAPWRGQDPTQTADALGARWVANAYVLYVGVAPGTGVRHLLQQRIKRFLRFGSGRNVTHWGGRFVWQLAGVSSLRIAWQVTGAEGARQAADDTLKAFFDRHGMPPFANDSEEDEA